MSPEPNEGFDPDERPPWEDDGRFEGGGQNRCEETNVPTDATRSEADGRKVLEGAAFFGLAGEVVRTIEPHTEADSAGLLVTFLASFGAAVGGGPHAMADGAKHPANLFIVLVGPTAKARKGTTWQQERRVMNVADPDFVDRRVMGGFGSGEAFVDAVAKEDDHRLFVVEPEWGRLLAVGRREGATLSPLIRQAWDGDKLAVRSRAATAVAEGAHIAVLGHITAEELRAKLLGVDMANGFANRHLFCEVRRSKLLPSGGDLGDDVIADLGRKVRSALDLARRVGLMRRTPEADALWGQLYRAMADDEPGGLVAALIARDAPQVLRLSVTYALTEGSSQIDVAHLEAAWAVWRYCRASVASLFAERTGDEVTDRLLDAVRRAGAVGLTTDGQHAALGRHTPAGRLKMSRELLLTQGLVSGRRVRTGGRPADVLVAPECERSETSEERPGAETFPRIPRLSRNSTPLDPEVAPPPTDADIASFDDEETA